MNSGQVSAIAEGIFRSREALITDDHIVYAKKETGWFHGSAYVNKDAIYPYHRDVAQLCSYIADMVRDKKINAVVGPTVGGVGLSQWTAHYLQEVTGKEVLSVYADEEVIVEETFLSFQQFELHRLNLLAADIKSIDIANAYGKITISVERGGIIIPTNVGTRRVLKRGYDKLVAGMRCLITEDIRNSGLTIKKTEAAIEAVGGEVVEVVALCDRSGKPSDCKALYTTKMDMFPEEDCPICLAKGKESVRQDLGKGKEFLIRQGLTQFLK